VTWNEQIHAGFLSLVEKESPNKRQSSSLKHEMQCIRKHGGTAVINKGIYK